MKKTNKALLICMFCMSMTIWSCKKDSSNSTVAPIESSDNGKSNSTTSGQLSTTVADLQLWGLGSVLQAEKSLDKTYPWYIDQLTTGTYWYVNCGPTAVTMALKWADPNFNKTALDARNTYRPTGGWWMTSDVTNYLTKYGINWRIASLPNAFTTLMNYLDKGQIVILCLDGYYLTYNASTTQHVGRFYAASGPNWGHFIVVKGYKIVDSKFYFEAYDPYSIGATYADNTTWLKGQNRYYTSTDISTATTIWWDYAIVVAPKGKQVVSAAAGLQEFVDPADVPDQKGY